MTNKIALSPNSLVGVPALEYIDALSKAGYDGIGLRMYASPGVNYESVTQPVAGNPSLMRDIKAALSDSGLVPYDILSYYLRPNFDLERMLPSLEFGAELGFPYALAIADDPDWSRQRDNLARLCDAAAALHMTVALEAPVAQNAVNTLPLALKLIAESERSNAVVCLDPFHFWRVGHAPELLKEAEPRLFPYTQIDDGVDTDGPPPRGRREIGKGSVPLFEILDALPPDLPLSVEWGRPAGSSYTPAEWAKIALDATRRFVDDYRARQSTQAEPSGGDSHVAAH
jgi:sugar phosphate isomerase/epimerase